MLEINVENGSQPIKVYTWDEMIYEDGLYHRANKEAKKDGIFLISCGDTYIISDFGICPSRDSWKSCKFVKYQGTITLRNKND